MNTIKVIRALVGTTAVAAGFSFSPAQAEVAGQDWKGYAGVNCLASSPNHNVRRSAIGEIGFANHGTSTITVFCPVVRDESVGGDKRVTAVAVRFRNRNSKVAGRCEFSSWDQSGAVKVDAKAAAAPFGHSTLNMGPLNANNWGSYVLSCQLPGLDAATGLPSYIVNYRVDEKRAP